MRRTLETVIFSAGLIFLIMVLIVVPVVIKPWKAEREVELTPIERQTGISGLRAEQFVYEGECYNVWRGGTHSGMIGVTKTTCADG